MLLTNLDHFSSDFAKTQKMYNSNLENCYMRTGRVGESAALSSQKGSYVQSNFDYQNLQQKRSPG